MLFCTHHCYSSLDIGLRTHLVHDLGEMYKTWNHRQKPFSTNMNIGSFLDSIDNPICYELISNWKKGKLQPTELYQYITKAFYQNEIDVKLAEKMLNLVLVDGGYDVNPNLVNFEATQRLRYESYCFDLISLNRSVLSYDGNEMEIYSHHGNKLILSRSEQSSYHVFSKNLRPPSHGFGIWWHHTKESEQLILLPPATLMPDNKPILLIGKHILLSGRQ